jgi:hypothetical protein
METTRTNYNKYQPRYLFTLAFNLVIVVSPLVLVLLPVNYFDVGKSICLSKMLAGVECYACGMTRGIMHLIHLDFSGAWQFNKLSFIVLPMLFPLWLKSLYQILGKKLPAILDKLM